jgi:hypothetical protein
VELTDSTLLWKNPQNSETKGTVATQDAIHVLAGLTHKDYYGVEFQFRNERKNGKVSHRYFWSKDLKAIQVQFHAAL